MLYHITDSESAKEILKHGLKPMIGKRSQLVNEEEPAVYLCNRRSVPYWKILLRMPVVLAVDIDETMDEMFKYSCYDEYVCKECIPPDRIKRSKAGKNTSVAMQDLCISYLDTFSAFARDCACFYDKTEGKDEEYLEYLTQFGNSITAVLPSLDYSSCSKSQIVMHMLECADDSMITFLDQYWNTDRKLYKQLLYYKKDTLYETRVEISKFISKHLSCCSNVNTGGWCY